MDLIGIIPILMNCVLFQINLVVFIKYIWYASSSVVLLGGVFEWFKDLVLKTGDLVRGPWVRIPPPPP